MLRDADIELRCLAVKMGIIDEETYEDMSNVQFGTLAKGNENTKGLTTQRERDKRR